MSAEHKYQQQSALTDSVTSLSGETIVVLVGENEEPFIVHEAPLHANSGFFEAALSKDWQESKERRVKLPAEEPKYFKTYVQWVYGHRLYIGATEHANYLILSHLYSLGGRLADCDFQDAVLDSYIATARPGASECYWLPSNEAIEVLYENTVRGDAARRLMVDLHVCLADESAFGDEAVDGLEAFTHELACALLSFSRAAHASARADGTSLALMHVKPLIAAGETTCKCHHHGEDKMCYSKKYA